MKQFKLGDKAWAITEEKIEEHTIESKCVIGGVDYLVMNDVLHPEEYCFDSLQKAIDADEGRTFMMFK